MSPTEAKRTQTRLGVIPDGIFGAISYAALFARLGAREAAQALGKAAGLHFPAYRIDTPLRLAHWLAQFGQESRGFTDFEEDLSYSAKRLCAVWPTRFPTLASAVPFAFNPQGLAEKVYSGRMGNGPGDGWTFRGRPALTGRDNYTACAARTGLDLVNHPDLASQPEHFLHIGCDFWAQHCLNADADRDDIEAITIKLNGGRTGLAERQAMLARAKAILL